MEAHDGLLKRAALDRPFLTRIDCGGTGKWFDLRIKISIRGKTRSTTVAPWNGSVFR
jgi:hypothetical protein